MPCGICKKAADVKHQGLRANQLHASNPEKDRTLHGIHITTSSRSREVWEDFWILKLKTVFLYDLYISYIYIIYICIYPSCFLMTCFSRFPERPGVSIHVEVHRATQVRGVEGLNLTWPVADFQITTVRSSRICKTCILREKRWTTDKNCRLWDFWVWDFWAAWRDVAQVPDIPTTQITRLSCGVNLQGEQVCRCDAGWYGPECNQLLASQHRKECFYGPHPSSSP